MEEQSSCVNERQLLQELTSKADDRNNENHKEVLILNHSNQDQCKNVSSNNNQGESLDGDCSGTPSDQQQLSEKATGRHCNEYEDTIEDWQEPSSYHLQLIDYNIKLMTQGSFNLTEILLNPSAFEDFGEAVESNPSSKNEAKQIPIFPFHVSTETSKSHSSVNQHIHPSTITTQVNQQQDNHIHHFYKPYPLCSTNIENPSVSSQKSWYDDAADDSNDPDWIYSSTASSYSSSTEETVSKELQLNSPKQSADKRVAPQESTIPDGYGQTRSPESKEDSLKRFFRSISNCKLGPSLFGVLKRRKEGTKKLIPDVNIFQDLDKVEEWSSNEPIPATEQITASDINRIKRGMINGRLYNIGHSQIKQIFPSFSSLDSSEKYAGSLNARRLRCPLCPNSLPSKYHAYDHIESLHTMSVNICVHCRTLLTSRRSCIGHRCCGIEPGRSAFLTLQEPRGAEANSLIITISDLLSVVSGKSMVKGKLRGSKMDSFERYFGNIHVSDCKQHSGFHNTLKRRQDCTEKLIPDVNIFQDLDRIEEWGLNEPIPPVEQVTVSDVNRIKRGMINGRLYNIGPSHLERIFPDLSLLSPSTKSRKAIHSFRCPLCPKSIQSKVRAYYHIESFHTMSVNICVHCRTLLTSQRACNNHRCESFKHGCSAVLTSQEPRGSKANSLIITKSDLVSVVSRKSTVEKKSSKMKEDSCERYFGSISECKLNSYILKNLERREEGKKDWILDENVFIDLDNIEEWDFNKPIPSADELTPVDINRIKKGMANGQLYNIGPSHIKQILPKLGSPDPLKTSADSLKVRRLRCPLCPKHFPSKNLNRHIESLHTKSLYFCKYCQTFTLYKNCSSHWCAAFSSNIDPDCSASETLPELEDPARTFSLDITGNDSLSTGSKESTLPSVGVVVNESPMSVQSPLEHLLINLTK